MSMIGNTLLNEIVNEKNVTDPKEILNKLNSGIKIALMQDKTENNDGMDVCLCAIEETSDNERKIIFSGAKRPIIIFDNDSCQVESHRGTAQSIGGIRRNRVKSDKEFEELEFNLKKGDKIYLSSDGFADQANEKRQKFGQSTLYKLITKIGSKNLKEQQQILEEQLSKHQGNTDQRDDITLMGIEL